jgi:hypothetical protein
MDVDFHPPSTTVHAINDSLVLSISRKNLASRKAATRCIFSLPLLSRTLLLLCSRLRDVGSQLGDIIFDKDTYPTQNRIVAKARLG